MLNSKLIIKICSSMHLYGYPFWATEISIKIGEELFLFFLLKIVIL